MMIQLFSNRLSIEAGGNAPFIVFDDANIDEAVEGWFPNGLWSDVHDPQLLSSANSEALVKHASVPTESTFKHQSMQTLPRALLKKLLLLKLETAWTKKRW